MPLGKHDPSLDRVTDYLMWVGGRFYSIETFIAEAKKLGISKRVAHYPDDVTVGKTRIFLAHDVAKFVKVRDWKATHGTKKGQVIPVFRPKFTPHGPVIFGYFVVSSKESVVRPERGLSNLCARKGALEIHVAKAAQEPERASGRRVEGGRYICGKAFIAIKPWATHKLPRFRGLKAVSGDRILARAAWEDWELTPDEWKIRKFKVKQTDGGTQMSMFSVDSTMDVQRLLKEEGK